jgi:hypothetical protein
VEVLVVVAALDLMLYMAGPEPGALVASPLVVI